jgi:lipopolysaccharide export system permease protein
MRQSKEKLDLGLTPGILDRYVASEFLFNYLIAIAVVLSLRVLIDLFIEFDEFVETKPGGAPGTLQVVTNILGFYGPKLFEFFRDFSGAIVLLAAAFSLTRMTRHNELTVVLASGISLKRVIVPIVLLGFVLNMLMVFDQEVILPRLADKLVRQHDEMDHLRIVRTLLLPDRDQSVLYAREYDPQSQTITDMNVVLRQEGVMVGQITADQAKWDGKGWLLVEGRRWFYGSSDGSGDSSGAAVKPVQIVTRYESDLTPEYLWLQRNSNYKSLMSSGELTGLLQRGLKQAEYNEVISEKHFRFADPVINMVMLMLGLPMLISREKRSTKTSMFLAFAGAGGCFVATFACKLLGGNVIDPFMSAALPIIVFTPLSFLSLDGIKT